MSQAIRLHGLDFIKAVSALMAICIHTNCSGALGGGM